MSVVVADTSPLRALHHVGLLPSIGGVFGTIIVPPAVCEELNAPASGFPPIDLHPLPGFRVAAPSDHAMIARLRERLDRGESEAITLAVELQARAVLIDERDGRRTAEALGIRVIGTLGVLRLLKRRGVIERMRQPIERLEREMRFIIATDLKEDVLREEGEWPA